MRGSILVVAILATLVLAPSASAMQLDPTTLKIVEPKVKRERPKPTKKPDHITKVSKMVLPVEYMVTPGDTLTKIAETKATTVQRLWQKNLQLTNPDILNIGDKLIIPTASEILADRPMPEIVVAASVPISRPVVPGNGYDPGNCTWFAKSQRPDIGNFWGNADQWGYSAAAEGYLVDNTPAVGSIGVATSYMHVVYITGVNGDGTVSLSEMNYTAPGAFSTRTAPVSEFVYIH